MATIIGTNGNDLGLTGFPGHDIIIGLAGNDILQGFEGNDVLDGGSGRDNLQGQQDNDIIFGGLGNDSGHGAGLFGGPGDDQLFGEQGNDLLVGDDIGLIGNDALVGGSGADVIIGGGGNDFLEGDTGVDAFVFAPDSGEDVVRDFVAKTSSHDTLNVVDYHFTGINDPKLHIAQTDAGAHVAFGHNDGVLLLGVAATDLTADDFSFA